MGKLITLVIALVVGVAGGIYLERQLSMGAPDDVEATANNGAAAPASFSAVARALP